MEKEVLSLCQQFQLHQIKQAVKLLNKEELKEYLASASFTLKTKEKALQRFLQTRELNLELDLHDQLQLRIAQQDYDSFNELNLAEMLVGVLFKDMLLNNALKNAFTGDYVNVGEF